MRDAGSWRMLGPARDCERDFSRAMREHEF